MKHILYLILVLTLPIFIHAQEADEEKKSKRQLSIEQINQLHDGVLLVRLRSKKRAIDQLRERNNHTRADEIEKEQAEISKIIFEAFRDHFDFCKTYFFWEEQSQNILEKKLEQVEFLNEDLQPAKSIKVASESFLLAEVNTTEGMGFGALIMMDEQFKELERPFPYYVRTLGSLPIRRTPAVVVEKMNIKLHKFYARHRR